MAMIGQRAGFKPILSQDMEDELMGAKNLEATSDQHYDGYPQYAATQEKISGLGDAYGDREAHFRRGVAADANSGMGAKDEQSNARYQELSERREELKEQIQKLTADIVYQEKLRALEMKNDPMWDIAKQQYILKGDSSGLENIMQRMEAQKGRDLTEKVAQMNKAQEDANKKDARKADYEDKLNILNFILDDNKSKFNTPEVRSAIFRAWNDVDKAARNAGISLDNDIKALEAQYPMYGNIKGFLGLSEKTPSVNPENAPEGSTNEDMTQLETRFNNAKTAKDMEAILKSAEGKIDPTKKTEWQEKIKNAKDAEKKLIQNRKDWNTKAQSALKRVMGWSKLSRQRMFDRNNGNVQDFVEQIDGEFRIKKNPYGG